VVAFVLLTNLLCSAEPIASWGGTGILPARLGAPAPDSAGLQPVPADTKEVRFTEQEKRRIFQHSPLPPPPPDPTNAVADDPAAARLGERLFLDPRLSGNGQISCATCHQPERHFTDGKPLAEGLSRVERHTPALWNVAYNRWYFWDGRADTLWSQALVPIERPDEMGGSRTDVARRIASDRELRTAYEQIFGPIGEFEDLRRFPPGARPHPDGAGRPEHTAWEAMAPHDRERVERVFTNAGKAIAAYERKLLSRHSAFDVFVEGLRSGDAEKLAALSPAAQRGLRLFIGRGNCRLCHSGPNFTDGEFHSVRVPPLEGGLPRDPGRYRGIEELLASPFNAAGRYSDQRDGPAADKLRHLARKPDDWGRFKTPSLRNVALTPPYMHQGQLATLEEVIEHYSTFSRALPPGHHQQETFLVPLQLTEQEKADLKAFLEALTGLRPANRDSE
jgi:cytochrome c peroxidase